MMHVEGKKNIVAKDAFEKQYMPDFKNDFDALCRDGILKTGQRHKTAILASLTDTIPNLIKKGTLEEELAPVYEKAFGYYEVLNQYVLQQ